MYKHCFLEGPSERFKRNRLKRSPVLDAGGKRRTGRKPREASFDWKPNGHTVPGPGIEHRISGPQRRGSTATLPAW